MESHEVSDGTYPATVATRTDSLVALISSPCDPIVLVVSKDTLPETELTADDSITITISDGSLDDLETDTD
jgi:hypothetical protein